MHNEQCVLSACSLGGNAWLCIPSLLVFRCFAESPSGFPFPRHVHVLQKGEQSRNRGSLSACSVSPTYSNTSLSFSTPPRPPPHIHWRPTLPTPPQPRPAAPVTVTPFCTVPHFSPAPPPPLPPPTPFTRHTATHTDRSLTPGRYATRLFVKDLEQ